MTTSAKELGTFTDTETIRHRRLLPGSIEQVWAYLTEPSLLARWLAGGSFDARVGGHIDLDFDLIQCPGREEVHGLMHGVITEFAPPGKLVYTWQESHSKSQLDSKSEPGSKSEPDSWVTFELEPAPGDETLLTLTHTRILAKDRAPIAAGWHIHIDTLVDRLQGREPSHFMNEYYALEPAYKQLLASEVKK